uniref:Uncharacterized protein n=1 Tax=Arundo donax TaxID=35708 RepID=A0A0A8Y309_ARUDO
MCYQQPACRTRLVVRLRMHAAFAEDQSARASKK